MYEGIKLSGFAVTETCPPSMGVRIGPGTCAFPGGSVVSRAESASLPIRPAGRREYRRQAYTMRGEGAHSPAGWNGEDIRGSGGAPYQRIVPGSLAVWSKNRTVRYEPEQDYTFDYYWGTVKRNPAGRIADGEALLLDYDAWLCRYDAVVLYECGDVRVIEGSPDAPESRELLLPDPPDVRDGIVLAHVFTGWGRDAVTGGRCEILCGESHSATEKNLPKLAGRYEDMAPRTYYAEVLQTPGEGVLFRTGAAGEEYSTGERLTERTMRWTDPFAPDGGGLPLLMRSAHGFDVDWGLRLDLTGIEPRTLQKGMRFAIEAEPQMIFDLRARPADPAELIETANLQALDGVKEKLRNGGQVRVAFFGESTTRAGHWPYVLAGGLRAMYPHAAVMTHNVAIGGESSVTGVDRMEHEVLPIGADVVFVEYMINDACSGDTARIEGAMRRVLQSLRASGSAVVLMTHNGMNPYFWKHGSSRNFRRFHTLMCRLAGEYGAAFFGGWAWFARLHECGVYFLTELKGNMVNHPFGNVDPRWGGFDGGVGKALLALFR